MISASSPAEEIGKLYQRAESGGGWGIYFESDFHVGSTGTRRLPELLL